MFIETELFEDGRFDLDRAPDVVGRRRFEVCRVKEEVVEDVVHPVHAELVLADGLRERAHRRGRVAPERRFDALLFSVVGVLERLEQGSDWKRLLAK